MKLHHLRDFVAVSKAQSVRGAARALGLAQPAVTRSLHELEKELGATLLDRHTRGVALTPSGRAFLVRANAAMEELRRGREELDQARGADVGTVVTGVATAPLLQLVPKAYKAFRRAHPLVRMRFMEGAFSTLEPRLRDGTLDFYVGPRPERVHRSYQVDLIHRNERCVLGRKGHPLRGAGTLRKLLSADWVLTGLRERPEEEFDEQFKAVGLPTPASIVQADAMLSILTLVTSTDALAFLPRQWADSPLFRHVVEAIPVKEPLEAPDIVRIVRAGVPLTPLADQWSDLLMRQAGIRPIALS
jgi:LysR family transcriptional regulator, regulator of abg operon